VPLLATDNRQLATLVVSLGGGLQELPPHLFELVLYARVDQLVLHAAAGGPPMIDSSTYWWTIALRPSRAAHPLATCSSCSGLRRWATGDVDLDVAELLLDEVVVDLDDLAAAG
jgi:hypothetical protein